MAYTPINWTNTPTTPLDADNLNHVESGVIANELAAKKANESAVCFSEALGKHTHTKNIYTAANWSLYNGITMTPHADGGYVSFNGAANTSSQTFLLSLDESIKLDANKATFVLAKIRLRAVGANVTVSFRDDAFFNSTNVIATNAQTITGTWITDKLTDGEWRTIWVVTGGDKTITKLGVQPLPTTSDYELQVSSVDCYYSADGAEVADIIARLAAAEGNITVLQNALEQSGEDIRELQSTVNGSASTSGTVKNQIATAKTEIIQGNINPLAERVTTAESNISTLSSAGEAVRGQIDELKGDLDELKGEVYTEFPSANLYKDSCEEAMLNVYDNGTYHSSSSLKGVIIPIEGNKGLITVKKSNVGTRFRVGTSVDVPADGVPVSKSQTYDGGVHITITPNVADRYMLVVFYSTQDTISYEQAKEGLTVFYGSVWTDGSTKFDDIEYRLSDVEGNVDALISKKNFGNILFLGDSYTADSYTGNTEAWINQLAELCDFNRKKIGVGSATIRDKYSDRNVYPYTSRPVQASNTGNLNTFACQIEKLKRLIIGTDLDTGETKYIDTPNIIFIQGGINDGIDSDIKESAYEAQFYTEQTAFYKMRDTDTSAVSGKLYVKTDIDTVDRTSFAGALRYLYEELHTLYPNAKIYVIAPSSLSWGTGNNIKAIKKTEQIKKACAYLSIPVIEWATETGINYLDDYMSGSGTQSDPYIIKGESQYSKDRLHPNVAGAKILAKAVYNRLRYDFG